MSVLSAGCVVWLDALRPLFALTAVLALVSQGWLVLRRPKARRRRVTWAILAGTVAANALVALSWAALWWRYR